jgi:sn-glycerol 3-phosphate transport system ATP-binding protein
MASIALHNVIKRYGQGHSAVQVIHGVNAEIKDGEFIVIVGPSGCGKSTLLRMVAGLEEISGGQIQIGARVVNDLEPAQRDIAMVFQNYALYPHMSVFDNMAYGLKIAKLSKAEIKSRVDKAAKILELGHLLERKPRQLSGGQRQRVAMGRAIVRQPQVFLFDEPLSNLDAKLRVQTRLEIQKLHRELGITSLFVTHDQVEAMTLAQRMIVMNAGRMEQFGSPEQVYARPASTFVASFIGSPPMNLIQGTASAGLLQLPGHQLTLPGTVQPPRQGSLILGIRPEHLQVLPAGARSATGACWPLWVEMVEVLGAEHLIYGKLGGADSPAAIVVRSDESVALPAIGSTLALAPRADRLHWFDAETGLRINPAEQPAPARPSAAQPVSAMAAA